MNERLIQIAFGIVGALDNNNVGKIPLQIIQCCIVTIYIVSIAWLLKNVEKKTWEYFNFCL